MLTHGHDRAVLLPPHDALQRAHFLPDLYNLGLNERLDASGHGSEVGDVECAAHAEKLPEAGLVDERQGQGGGVVEEGGRAASVEVV